MQNMNRAPFEDLERRSAEHGRILRNANKHAAQAYHSRAHHRDRGNDRIDAFAILGHHAAVARQELSHRIDRVQRVAQLVAQETTVQRANTRSTSKSRAKHEELT